MKKIALFLTLILTSSLFSQTYELPVSWKFITHDSIRFAEPDYDDRHWSTVAVPGQWETQGFQNYDGYAWYRVEFSVPPSALKEDLYLLLGKIDDVDDTFLNGIPVGSMGKFPPNDESAWNKQRVYHLTAKVLKRHNTLAIRVYDGGAPGGIIGGLIGLYTKKAYIDEMYLGPAPKKSYTKLTTTNGLIAAVYDDKTNRIENVLPHIFQAYDSSHSVRPFAFGIRPNITERPSSVRYEANTHVIHAQYKRFTIDYFAPFTTQEKIFYAVVRGKENDIATLAFESHTGAGELLFKDAARTNERYFLFSFNDPLHNNSIALQRAAERIASSNTSLVDDELQWMKRIFSSARIPRTVTPKERNVIEQSISVLKMSQVGENEVFPLAKGQILASLPPGVWNIAWVRDGSYSIMALARLGLFNEAKMGLEFMLNAESNHYKKFIHTDGNDHGIGMDYQISVCRYFGIGKEESDFNAEGPNIEIDGFGLFLSALSSYVRESGDTAFVRAHLPMLTERIAEPILHSIAENGLIRKESGPWERHLPGEQYSYTSAVCAAGLHDLAELCTRMSIPAERYFSGAAKLTNGILTNLVDNDGAVIGRMNAPKGHKEYYDGGSFEVFASRTILNKELFLRHMKAFEPVLRVPDPQRGYIRIKSPDWYESQEWLFLDARIATAYLHYGEKKKAKHLIDWITAQSTFNYNLIPEMYGYDHATYEGAIPMVGFGAGTYVLALLDYYR